MEEVTIMTKQVKTIIISLVVTLIVLFGGYQGYQYFKIDKPIKDVFLTQQKDISISKIKFNPSNVQIQLNVKPTYSYIDEFPSLTKQLNEILGEGKWSITFTNTQTPTMKQAWKEIVFGVKEGIYTGRYTLIHSVTKQIANKYHLSYDVYMDDQYVYLMLRDGNKSWYQILPMKEVK
jgi:hypothetical protein